MAQDDSAPAPAYHDSADDHEHDDFDTVVIALPKIANPRGSGRLHHAADR